MSKIKLENLKKFGKEALVKGLKAVSEYFAWKEKELEK